MRTISGVFLVGKKIWVYFRKRQRQQRADGPSTEALDRREVLRHRRYRAALRAANLAAVDRLSAVVWPGEQRSSKNSRVLARLHYTLRKSISIDRVAADIGCR